MSNMAQALEQRSTSTPGDFPAVRSTTLDPWQLSVDRLLRCDLDAVNRCQNIREDIHPSLAVVRQVLPNLLARVEEDPSLARSICQLRGLVSETDRPWVTECITATLDRLLLKLAIGPPTLNELLPAVRVLTEFSSRELTPTPELLKSTFEGLLASAVELSSLHREAGALGFPLEELGSTLEYRVRVAHGLKEMFDLGVDIGIIIAALDRKDLQAVRMLGKVGGYSLLESGDFNLVTPDGTSYKSKEWGATPYIASLGIEEVFEGFARERDVRALGILSKLVDSQKIALSPEAARGLIVHLSSQPNFGTRFLDAPATQLCLVDALFPVQGEIPEAHILRARANYLDPTLAGYFHTPDHGPLSRLPRVEQLLELPYEKSHADFRAYRILESAKIKSLQFGDGTPEPRTLEDAVTTHLAHIRTPFELRMLFAELRKLVAEDGYPLIPEFDQVLAAGKRAGISSPVIAELFFSLFPEISPRAAERGYLTAFNLSDTAEEFLRWTKTLETRSGVAFDLAALKKSIDPHDERAAEALIEARVFELGIASLAAGFSGCVERVRHLEDLLGQSFKVSEGFIEPAFAQVLSPILSKDDSFLHRRQIWKECGDAYVFLKERSGTQAPADLLQKCFAFMFTYSGIQRADLERYTQITGAVMEPETVQRAYRSTLYRLAIAESPNDADMTLNELEHTTGVSLQITDVQLEAFCQMSQSRLDNPGPRIALLLRRAGLPVSVDFIRKFILDDNRFESPLTCPVPRAALEEHFSQAANQTQREYLRIIMVLQCKAYYEERLERLSGREDTAALRERIYLLAALANGAFHQSEEFAAIRTELLAIVDLERQELLKDLQAAIRILIAAGDIHLGLEGIGPNFSKYRHSAIGVPFVLKPTKDTAEVLWDTLLNYTDRFDSDGSKILAEILLRKLPDTLLPPAIGQRLSQAFEAGELENVRDLRFLEVARGIPSLEVRGNVLDIMADQIILAGIEKRSISEQHARYRSIPGDVFVQVGALTGWSAPLLAQFELLYRRNRSRATLEALQFAITNTCRFPAGALQQVQDFLSRQPTFGSEDGTQVARFFANLSFSTMARSGTQWEAHVNESAALLANCASLDEAITQLATHGSGKLVDYFSALKESAPAKLLDALQHWSDPTPMQVYLSKLAFHGRTKELKFLKDLLPHTDPFRPEEWKRWRYDETCPQVQDQLRVLNTHQREIWRQDYLVPMGDIDLSFGAQEKGTRVLGALQTALRLGSPNDDRLQTESAKVIQTALHAVERAPLGDAELILRTAGDQLGGILSALETVLKLQRLPDIERFLELRASTTEVPISAKTRGFLHAVGSFLPESLRPDLYTAFNAYKKQGARTALLSALITEAGYEAILQEYHALHSRERAARAQRTIEQFRLTGSRIEVFMKCHRIAREVGGFRRLADLAADAAALQAHVSDQSDQEEATIARMKRAIVGLRRSFHGSPLAQELDNIGYILKREEGSTKGSALMLWTDNPEVLLQIGKFPLGCGSCKNYEGSVETNVTLTSDLGDAHIKAALLLDVERLPDTVRAHLTANDRGGAAATLSTAAILQACVARSLVKITVTQSDTPALFLEETYSPFDARSGEIEEYFRRFVTTHLAEPMGVLAAREGNDFLLEVPASRSPAGQYEDRRAAHNPARRMGVKKGLYTMKVSLLPSGSTAAEIQHTAQRSGEVTVTDLGSGHSVERRFDLETYLVEGNIAPRELETAARAQGCHIAAVKGFKRREGDPLLEAGFVEVPAKIGYVIELPRTLGTDATFDEAYLARFSGETKRRSRRDLRRLQALVDAGTLSVTFDQGRDRHDFERFLKLYEREMGNKSRGWTPLSNAIHEQGGSLTRYLRNGRLGVFLKRGDEVIAGIIASRGRTGYSIDYQASDTALRGEIPEMSRFLVTRLLKRGFTEGDREASFGVDSNLYGHHLSVGLLRSKSQLGFRPSLIKSERRFVKVVDPTPLGDPFFHYSVGASGRLTSNVYFRKPPTPADVSLFEGLTEDLRVWVVTPRGVIPFSPSISEPPTSQRNSSAVL